MELSWSTFVLEIINFLVLVWILKRFLYKPVLDIIARRRAEVEKTRADAAQLQANAGQMQTEYEGRLAKWEQERQQARQALARELEDERARRISALQTTLEQEREKTRVAEMRRQADALRKTEETALQHAANFAARLLEQAAGPDVEARLIAMLTTELSQSPAERIATWRNNFGEAPATIAVRTAYPLAAAERHALEQALARITAQPTPVSYSEDSTLLAGAQITIGAWVLAANLRDELQGFAELAHDD